MDIQVVIKTVCDYYQQHPARVLSPSQKQEYLQCREVITYIMLEGNEELNPHKIAHHLNRTPAALYNSMRNMRNYMQVDKKLQKEVADIQCLVSTRWVGEALEESDQSLKKKLIKE